MTEAEFTAVVEKNYGRFVRIVARYLNLQPSDAQDVVQCALIKSWRKLEVIRSDGEVEKWMIVCVINQGLDHLKMNKRYQRRLTKATQVKQMAPDGRSQIIIPL